MQLRFLGQTYSASNTLVSTVKTESQACFLGQMYTLRRPVKSLKTQSSLGLRKYRGVVYGDG